VFKLLLHANRQIDGNPPRSTEYLWIQFSDYGIASKRILCFQIIMLLCGISFECICSTRLHSFILQKKRRDMFCFVLLCLLFFVVSPAHLLIVVSSVNSASQECLLYCCLFFKICSKAKVVSSYTRCTTLSLYALASKD
jgi:hypothetical protein